MKTTRRTVLKSAMAFLMAPTVSLRRDVDREALLSAFCDPNYAGRYDLDSPFRHGSQTIATNAKILCRAEISAPVLDGKERRLPPVDATYKLLWHPGEFRPLELPPIGSRKLKYMPESPYTQATCPACGNRRISFGPNYPSAKWIEQRAERFDWDVDNNTIRDVSCPECRGKEYDGPTIVSIDGNPFDYWLLKPIAALPNVRVAKSKHESGVLCFTADGFDGLAMGLSL